MEEETNYIRHTQPIKNSEYSIGFQKLMENALRNINRPKNCNKMVTPSLQRKHKSKYYVKNKSNNQKHKTLQKQQFQEPSFVRPLFPSIGRNTIHEKKDDIMKKGIPHSHSFQKNVNNTCLNTNQRSQFSINSYFQQCLQWTSEQKEKILGQMGKQKYKLNNRMGKTRQYFKKRNSPSYMQSNLQNLKTRRHESEVNYCSFNEDLFTTYSNFFAKNQNKIFKNGDHNKQKNGEWSLDPWETEEDIFKTPDRIVTISDRKNMLQTNIGGEDEQKVQV